MRRGLLNFCNCVASACGGRTKPAGRKTNCKSVKLYESAKRDNIIYRRISFLEKTIERVYTIRRYISFSKNRVELKRYCIMVSLMLMSENIKESQILKLAFEQRGITVLESKPDHQNFLKALQYLPDLFMLELPKVNTQQLRFAASLRHHKKTKTLMIIAYGDQISPEMKRGVAQYGVNHYFERPLKFSMLISTIEKYLKQKNKELEKQEPKATDRDKDMELLLSADVLPMKKIETMVAYVSNMLAFPFTVAKTLSLADSATSAANDLAKVIEADPVMCSNILKVSNSIFFATVGRRISSIKDAVVRIGLKETKRIVLNMSVMKLFDDKNKNLGFDRTDFWYHSMCAGLIAERLAKRMGTINAEEAFLAGLLHDFGIIILDEFFAPIFSKCLEETTNKGGIFIHHERLMLKITHNDVVKELFGKWKLPETISYAVTQQYDFAGLKNAMESPEKRMSLCVAIGNILAKTLCIGGECDQWVDPVDEWFLKEAKLSVGFSQDFIDDLFKEVNVYREFLKLEPRDFLKPHQETEDLGVSTVTVVAPGSELFIPIIPYLIRKSIKVNRVSLAEAASKLDKTCDMVILWSPPPIDDKMITDYTHVVKMSPPNEADAAPKMVPLIVITDPDKAFPKDVDKKGVSVMPRAFDLRQFDEVLISTAKGTPVNMLGNFQEKKAPPTPATVAVPESTPAPGVTPEAAPVAASPSPTDSKTAAVKPAAAVAPVTAPAGVPVPKV